MNGCPRINMDGLRRGMEAAGLDALVAVSLENFFYVTDCLLLSQVIIPERLCMAVLPREGAPAVVVCYNEQRQTVEDSWITDVRTYLEYEVSPMGALADYLAERGWQAARIGIEKRFLPAVHAEELAGLLPDATLVAADGVFDAARAVKTPDEITLLTEAAQRTETAILDAFRAAAPGDTEKKVADDLATKVLSAGAVSFWITLAVGENTAVNHPFPSSRPLSVGDIMRVDVGGRFGGYQSDVARTAVIGSPDGQQRSVYARLREAQRELISAARPGTRACDLYALYQRAFERRGLATTSQAVGHSFGIGMHEPPVLHAHETAKLEPGMLLNIEPAATDAHGRLYHIEDLCEVTDDEPRILTNVMDTRELFVVQ